MEFKWDMESRVNLFSTEAVTKFVQILWPCFPHLPPPHWAINSILKGLEVGEESCKRRAEKVIVSPKSRKSGCPGYCQKKITTAKTKPSGTRAVHSSCELCFVIGWQGDRYVVDGNSFWF